MCIQFHPVPTVCIAFNVHSSNGAEKLCTIIRPIQCERRTENEKQNNKFRLTSNSFVAWRWWGKRPPGKLLSQTHDQFWLCVCVCERTFISCIQKRFCNFIQIQCMLSGHQLCSTSFLSRILRISIWARRCFVCTISVTNDRDDRDFHLSHSLFSLNFPASPEREKWMKNLCKTCTSF